jgi:transposase-like protein
MYPDSEIERLRSGFHARVVGDLKDGLLTYAEIAYKYGISAATVYQLARKYGCRHRADSAPPQVPQESRSASFVKDLVLER